MAITGRKPKPGPLRALEGNPGKRPLPRPHPLDATDKLPTCPAWMTTEQKRIWRDTVKEIKAVLAPADRELLAAFCVQVSLHRQAAELVAKLGLLIDGRNSAGVALVKNPADGQLNQHARLITTMAAELGLTPASRARLVQAPQDGDESRATRLLS